MMEKKKEAIIEMSSRTNDRPMGVFLRKPRKQKAKKLPNQQNLSTRRWSPDVSNNFVSSYLYHCKIN